MSNRLIRLFKEPLIQFLVIGAGIYGAYALFGAPEEDYRDNVIRVDSNRIEAMISGWESRWQRPPTRQEINGLIQQFIKEDVLYRQAVAMGLNEDDPITRRRMAQKLEFLTSDLAQLQQPSAGELEQYFRQNLASYRDPDRISFSQVFIDPDARGQATLVDAADILEQLKAGGEPDEKALQLGDRFMLQNNFVSASEFDVRRQLGSDFSEVVMGLEPGQWHGPVMSGYGVHLVYVYAFEPAPEPQFDTVRTRVLEDWHTLKREEFNERFLESLKARYEIVVDELPTGRLLDGRAPADEGDETASEPVSEAGTTT